MKQQIIRTYVFINNIILCGFFLASVICAHGLPRWLRGKESACNAGHVGWIPGSGRSPREGNGNPLQYSCLVKSMDGGAWQAAVCGIAKSWTLLSNFTGSCKGVQSGESKKGLLLLICLIVSNSLQPHGLQTPAFPVLHYLLEFAQIHVHGVGDIIQPSHSLWLSSPPALNLSQNQGLFK